MKRKITKTYLKKIYIFLIIALIYLPLIFLVFLSFSKPSWKGNIQSDFIWQGFENYSSIFNDPDILKALLNTLLIALVTTPISLTIAVFTCYGIWNNSKTVDKTVMSASKFSVVNPEIINGIGLSLLFASTWIPLGFRLGYFTVILSHISFCTPYAIIAIYPRFSKLNKNIVLASKDLGHSSIKTFFSIILPYLLPAIVAAGTIVVTMSFDDFVITNLVRGRVTTISTEMYNMAKGIKAWAVAFGSCTILIALFVISVRSVYLYKTSKKKIQHTNGEL